jgi:hypothetical protein
MSKIDSVTNKSTPPSVSWLQANPMPLLPFETVFPRTENLFAIVKKRLFTKNIYFRKGCIHAQTGHRHAALSA